MKSLLLLKSMIPFLFIALALIGCEESIINPFQNEDGVNNFMVIDENSDTTKCNIGFGIAISRPINDSLLLSYIGDNGIIQFLNNSEFDTLMATAIVLSTLEFDENTDVITIVLLDQDHLCSGSFTCLTLEQIMGQIMMPPFALPENSFIGDLKINNQNFTIGVAIVNITEEENSFEIVINNGTTITGETISCYYKGILPVVSD